MGHYDFRKTYQAYSNLDLMRILANERDYRPEALLAAREEIEKRSLDPEEELQLQSQLQTEKTEKERRESAALQRKAKWSNLVASLTGAVNPISETSSSLRRRIKILCVFFGLHSLFIWYTGVQYLQYLFTSPFPATGLYFLETLFLMLLLPSGVYLFWRGKQMGWIFLMGYTFYYILSALISFIVIFRMRPVESGLFSGRGILDELLDVPSLGLVIFLFVIFMGIAWTLDNQALKSHFRVSNRTYLWAVGCMLLILLVSFFSFAYY